MQALGRAGRGAAAVLASLGLLGSSACALPQGEGPQALRERIAHAVGAAPCDADAQCRTLPLGARACGGPSAWLAYSERQGDAAQLQRWADELARAERAQQQREGRMSICSVLPDPGAQCVAGRCTLRQAPRLM